MAKKDTEKNPDEAVVNGTAPEADTAPELVKMHREVSGSGPTEADVHPDEVENFRSGGWVTE